MSDKDRLDELEGRIHALTTVNVMMLNKAFVAQKDRDLLLRALRKLAANEVSERSESFVRGYTETMNDLIQRAFRPRDN